MNAALIDQAGMPPVYTTLPRPQPGAGHLLVRVSAAALSHVTKSRATGRHYGSSGGVNVVPGIDGTGVLEDGRRVYFMLPEPTYGSLAEYSVVDPDRCIELPDNVSEVVAAALAIPGMSSWAALKERARFTPGGTVLVNGATGVSGSLAVQVARRLGAAKVIATGRDADVLARLGSLGADATISLRQEAGALGAALEAEFRSGVDVVLDYLWGSSAEAILAAAARAAPEGFPVRHVQFGSASGPDITLASAVLRSSSIEMLGSGLNSVALPKLQQAVRELFDSASANAFDVSLEAVPLRRIAELWNRSEARPRLVFTTDALTAHH